MKCIVLLKYQEYVLVNKGSGNSCGDSRMSKNKDDWRWIMKIVKDRNARAGIGFVSPIKRDALCSQCVDACFRMCMMPFKIYEFFFLLVVCWFWLDFLVWCRSVPCGYLILYPRGPEGQARPLTMDRLIYFFQTREGPRRFQFFHLLMSGLFF